MKTNELILSLGNQENNFDKLIKILNNKKNAIISNNTAQLDELLKDEERVLAVIQNEEKKRKTFISEIAAENSVSLKDSSLEEFINKMNNLPKDPMEKIKSVRKSIREKAARIVQLNSHLALLTEISRNLIKESLLIAFGQGKQLVNRKV
ncbi:MAG: flagellar export chaperone FlgN [Ignavibacteriales bacterium]|nr:flagellar export chaperone FlgN [Ignavibacteriales bacterium]